MATKRSTKKRTTTGRTTTPKKAPATHESGEACCKPSASPCSGALYGLGFIGALVYYISTATGFWVGVWGVIKALLWPAFLIFELMTFLMM